MDNRRFPTKPENPAMPKNSNILKSSDQLRSRAEASLRGQRKAPWSKAGVQNPEADAARVQVVGRGERVQVKPLVCQ